MNIAVLVGKLKGWGRVVARRDIFLFLLVVLVGLGSFGLGRLSALEEHRPSVRIIAPDGSDVAASSAAAVGAVSSVGASVSVGQGSGQFVASKNGTKYYPVGCASANRIKNENKVWFATQGDAESAGFTSAANCK